MRQSRKSLKLIIAILGTALAAALIALAILVLHRVGEPEAVAGDFVYDDAADALPPVKITKGMLSCRNEAGEWVNLVTLEELFGKYGGDIGAVIPSATPAQNTPAPATSTPGGSPAATTTSTVKPATPKPATPKPATPKPATPSPTLKPTTPPPATPKPPTPPPATPKPPTPPPATPKPPTPPPATPSPSPSSGGGDGEDIDPSPGNSDWGGTMP